MIVKTMNDHNHDNDLLKQEVKKIVSEKVAIAVENNVSPRAALSDISNKVLSDNGDSSGLAYLPKQASFARIINLKKADKLKAPPVPKTWDEMEVPDCFKFTADNQPFLIMDIQLPDSEKKIWGFGSEAGLLAMSKAEDIFVDGTFEFVDKTLFSQI